jgi:hypothetical protein
MRPETKLKIRKRVLMALRSIVWTVDEWLHAAELRLQDDLASRHSSLATVPKSLPAVIRSAAKRGPALSVGAVPARVTFQEWEARKSGVSVSARPRRQRAHGSSADFDRELRERFSRSAS